MIGRLLLILLISLPAWCSAADFSQFKALTETPDILRGQFVQSKYISALETELESSGTFAYHRGTSIEWRTLMPIENILTLTPTRMVTSQGDKEFSRLESDGNPAVAIFSNIFFGVMTAEWEQLAEYFSMRLELDGAHWLVTLLPKNSTIEQVVMKVELRGDKWLRDVRVYEAGSDLTHIRFIDLQQE